MQVFLDQRACDLSVQTIGEAIAGAAAIAERDGRLIVDVIVDGDRWGEDDLSRPELIEAGADEVRLVTADPKQLARDVFADAATALGEADTLQRRAAEQFQSDEPAAAMEHLETALDIWANVRQAVDLGAGVTGADLDSLRAGEHAAGEVVARLGRQLRDLKNAVGDRDHVTAADILLYEMPPVVEQWRELLVALQKHAQ